ncbi:MAG: LacI family DNA-binding transcriptional regulator [Spirochaetota bacterium]
MTVKDIARRVGVHYTTVATVLRDNNTSRASEKTRRAILRTARTLGYRGNILASNMRRGLKRLAVIICAEDQEMIYYPYYQEIIAGLQDVLSREGRTLSFHFYSHVTKGHILKNIDSSLYAGLIVLGNEKYNEIESLAAHIPTLQINYRIPSKHRHYLLRDEEAAARTTFSYCAEKGRRRVTGVFLYATDVQKHRQDIYERIAKEFLAITFSCTSIAAVDRQLYTYDMARSLYNSITDDMIRRIVRSSDVILGLSTYCELLYRRMCAVGIRIPEDIGFLMDGAMYAERVYFPEVSRVGVRTKEMIDAIISFFETTPRPKTIELASHIFEGATM